MSIKPADQYIQKLNQIPPKAKQILQNVRELDKKVLKLQLDIQAKRENALERIMEYQRNKASKQKSEIDELLKSVNTIHKQMIKLTKQKKSLVEELYNAIDEPTQQLEHDLTTYMPQLINNEQKQSKSRRGKKDHDQYLDYQPSYCYCKRPSFGLMVQCDNKGCQIQWFHTDCVDENNQGLTDNWYCRECRKTREKKRNS